MSIVERLSTSYLTVRKPVFELYESVPQVNGTASSADIGYYGSYYDGTTVKYTGLYRDESDTNNTYKLFDSLLSGGLPNSDNNFVFSTEEQYEMKMANLEINNLTAAAGTFTENVSGVAGSFTGAVSGASGSFTGAVSGASGSFTGAVSGSTGTFSGALTVDDTSNSTSTSTGSIQTDGGLGVAQDVWIGGSLHVAGDVSIPPNPFEVIIKDASATLTDAELKANAVVFVDAKGEATITLPVLSELMRSVVDEFGNVLQNYSYRVSIVNLTGNDVTLAAGAGNTIEGQASFVLKNQYDKQTLIAGPAGKTIWLIE